MGGSPELEIDFSNLSYTGRSLSLTGMNPSALFFKPDGTKLYVLDITSDTVVEYGLSTAWDISSATANGNTLDYTSNTSGNPAAMFFKSDGTQLYLCEALEVANIDAYDLSSAWDVSSATYSATGTLDAAVDYITGCTFSSDGSSFFVVTGGNTVYSQNMYTNWDVEAINTIYSNFDVSSEQSHATGIILESDGVHFHIIGYSPAEIHTYEMSTPYSAGTSSLIGTSGFSVTEGDTIAPYPHGLYVSDSHVYVVDNDDCAVYEYTLDEIAASFTGTVYEVGVPVARTVRAHNRSTGALTQEVTSDGSTGAFTFDSLESGVEYYIVALDNDTGEDYNAIIYDRIVGVT
jgi:hypothetical protein